MQNIGKILREARLQSDRSIDELHEQTRIVKEHLKQLEQNDFSFLPETYVKSFLKIYVEALKLDSDEILLKYEENAAEERRLQKEFAQISAEETVLEPKRRFIEWSLGFASVVLLIALIFVYMQYKSQIHAEPIANMESLKPALNTFADIEFNKSNSDNSLFDLQIKAKENIWLQLTIDDKKVEEYILVPEQILNSKAESRFEIAIGKIETENTVSTGNGLTGKEDNVVRLIFSKKRSPEN